MKNWYQLVNILCYKLSVKYKCELWQVAGILTALSAQKPWHWNIRQTIQFLKGIPMTGMYSQQQVRSCKRILSGENPLDVFAARSFKYRQFYQCIINPDCSESVCVDTHMISWYKQRYPNSILQSVPAEKIFTSKRYYTLIQNSLRKEAKKQNLLPMEVQALIWAEQRGGNPFTNSSRTR